MDMKPNLESQYGNFTVGKGSYVQVLLWNSRRKDFVVVVSDNRG